MILDIKMAKKNEPKIIKKKPSLIGKIIAGAGVILAAYALWNHYAPNDKKSQELTYSTKPITLEALKSYQGVEKIIDFNGNIPEKIIVLQIHPNQNNPKLIGRDKKINTEPIQKIFDQLYESGLRDIIIEGLEQDVVADYNKNGSVLINNRKMGPVASKYMSSLEKLLNSHPWRLHSAEKKENDDAIKGILAPLFANEDKIIKDFHAIIKSYCTPYMGKSISQNQASDLNNKYEMLIADANNSISNAVTAFFTPQVYTNLVHYMVSERDRHFSSAAQNTGLQTALLLGIDHALSITNVPLGNYAILKPEGIKEEPRLPSIESFRDLYTFKVSSRLSFENVLKQANIKVSKK